MKSIQSECYVTQTQIHPNNLPVQILNRTTDKWVANYQKVQNKDNADYIF